MAATAEAEESDDPYHYNDDDDDDDLQAALALSLHGGESQKSSNACAAVVTSGSHYHYGEKPPPTTTTTTPPPSTGHRSPLPYSYNSAHDDGNFDRKASLLQKRDDDDDDDDGHCFIFDCRSFQKLMWIDDDTSSSTTTGSTTTTTTIDDKQRWICECLQLRELQLLKHGNNHPHSSSGGENENIESDIHIDAVAASVNNEKTIADRVSADDAGNNSMMSNRQTPLEMFTGFNLSSEQVVPPLPTTTHPSQPIWCLTQTHGGPCGVLAAVQAEMIRILLFGRRDPVKLLKDGVGGFDSGIGCRDDSDVMGGGGEGRRRRRRCHRQLSDTLYYPFEIAESSSSATTVSSPITEREVHDSMAMAIGMILARAALAPCTSTAADAASSSPLQTNASRPAAAAAVRLVLPTAITSHDSHPTTTTLMEMTITTPSPPPSSSSSSSSPATINTNLLQELLFAPPMGKSTANYLMVHTIIVDGSTTNDNKSVANGNDNENNDPELPDTKRRRNTCMDSGSKDEIVDGRGEEDTISFDKNDKTLFTSATSTTATTSTTTTTTTTTPTSLLTALAISVANFLISEWGQLSNRDNEVKRIIDGSAECSPANETSSSLLSSPLEYFQGPGGVMYLVMSLVSTRSIDRIRADMDDPNTSLTSNFGHSSQELMNLLLTGQAVSNVFDNSMKLSDDLTCRGIQSRSAIGYLSILESLRYCEVGGYYKSPTFPIWIVGSTSHFSVLFGDEQCLVESKSDILLEKCRRAFQKVEGGNGENGFIPMDKLGGVLDELDLTAKVGGDDGVSTLKAYLEVSGAGIILWDDFWKACSRLMSGSSLEVIMSGEDHLMRDVNDYRNNNQHDLIDLGLSEDFLTDGNNIGGRSYLFEQIGSRLVWTGKMPTKTNEDAPFRTSYIDSVDTKMPADRDRAHSIHHIHPNDEINEKMPAASSQSDEELARKLAAEWGSLPDQEEVVTMGMKSDEEYARNLQAMWDAEVTGGDHGASSAIEVSSHVATTDEVASLLASDDDDDNGSLAGAHLLEGEKMMMDESMTSTIHNTAMDTSTPTAARSIEETTTTNNGIQSQSTRQQPLNSERHGHSFPLFHYNGLRGGKMTCFRVQKLSPTEAVGASIASSSTVGTQHGCSSGACDLEDIVRTKWPSSLVNWFGEPPSID